MLSGIPIRVSLGVLVLATALPFIALSTYNTYARFQRDAERAAAEALRGARAASAEAEETLQRARVLLAALARRPAIASLDMTRCAPIFNAFLELYPEYTNLLTIQSNGERQCSAVPPAAGTPSRVDPSLYLDETIRTGAFTVGRVTRGVFTGRWITVVAHPILGASGEVRGVVAVSIDLAGLRLIPRNEELPPRSIAHIVDDKGVVIASSEAKLQMIGQSIAEVPWFRLLSLAGAGTGSSPDAQGVEHIFGVTPIAGTNWHAAVGIAADEVYGPLWKRTMVNIAVYLIALLLAVMLAWMIAYRTARPIEAIAAAIRRATQSAQGSAVDAIPIDSLHAPREIQMLAGDFRTMLLARTVAERELRESEERLRRLNAVLEARVEERTRELGDANRELGQLNRELGEVNRELEAFSYSVSHDLKAPLRIIEGYSRIVLEDHAEGLSVEGRSHLQTVRDQTARMGELIDSVLKLARVSRRELLLSPVDLTALVHSCLDELGAQQQAHRLEVIVDELPVWYADSVLARQLFLNLLSNAMKYSQKRDLARIEVRAESRGGEHVVHVSDNGSGFDMDYAGKLFGVFQRLHSQSEFPGTGIGLAIVSRIAQRHGARIWAESALDQGATFFLAFRSAAESP